MIHETMTTVDIDQLQPISRTYQYRKVMKPMLERKRRARINRCLDELKELMVTALQSEGENVSKLEKADILELTVRHLHKLRRQQRLAVNPVTDADRFRAGFTHCATEVSRCLAATPGVDVRLGTKLMTHLGHRLNDMDRLSPLSVRVQESGTTSPAPSSPASVASYSMPLTPASSTASSPDTDYTHNTNASTTSTSNPSQQQKQQHSGLLLKVVETLKSKSEPVWRPW